VAAVGNISKFLVLVVSGTRCRENLAKAKRVVGIKRDGQRLGTVEGFMGDGTRRQPIDKNKGIIGLCIYIFRGA